MPRPLALSVIRIVFGVPLLALPLAGALCGNTAPKNPQELIQEQACVKNIEAGDYDRAETRCEICLEFNERNPECLNGLGLVWYARGVDEKSREYFKTCIRENNDHAQCRNNFGVLEFERGNFEESATLFASAIEVDPRYLDGRYNLALSYLRLGQRRFASTYAEEFKRAKAGGKDPHPDQVALKIADGDKKFILDKYGQAETEYRKIFELYPEHADSYRDMGVILSHRAQLEPIENKRKVFVQDAEQFFVRCLDLNPESEPCHESVAHLFLATGRYDEALFHYVQCLAANKNNPTCSVELKQAYAGSQMQSEALLKYMNQLAENPGYAPGHYGFCMALFDKGLVDMAVTECENALKLDGSLCLAHYQLGMHYKQVLDKDRALEHCRGLISCAGETRYATEAAECKELVQALEVQ